MLEVSGAWLQEALGGWEGLGCVRDGHVLWTQRHGQMLVTPKSQEDKLDLICGQREWDTDGMNEMPG